MGTDPIFREDCTMKTVAAALLFALLGGGCAATGGRETPFVASWAAGHIQPLPDKTPQYGNQTLREVVRLSAGGEYVGGRIATPFGTGPPLTGEARIRV